MAELNPYQPTTVDEKFDDSREQSPPLRYRFVAATSSSIGTLLLVLSFLATLGALWTLFTLPQYGLPAQMLRDILTSSFVMVVGVGMIYAGILWYNVRVQAAIIWSILSGCMLVVASFL